MHASQDELSNKSSFLGGEAHNLCQSLLPSRTNKHTLTALKETPPRLPWWFCKVNNHQHPIQKQNFNQLRQCVTIKLMANHKLQTSNYPRYTQVKTCSFHKA